LDEILNERVLKCNTFEKIQNLNTPRKLKEMPNPLDLQKKLDELKKIKVEFKGIDDEIVKAILNKPHGIT
jgi:hypothetical protein